MQKRGKAPSRRWHPKTRTGCATCKSRKIKCDEKKPQCQNCIRHGTTCAFLTAANDSHQSSPSAPSPTTCLAASPHQSVSLNLLDLELLHHYFTSTGFTLTEDPVLNEFWRTTAVEMGYTCEFIMRGILAFSAMHLAGKCPKRKDTLTTVSLIHYNAASQMAMDTIPSATPNDSENLFIFSVLTVYLVLCNSQGVEDAFSIGNDMAPNWMFLFNGTLHLAVSTIQSNNSSTILPIVERSKSRFVIMSSDWKHTYLEHLSLRLEEWAQKNPDVSAPVIGAYRHATRELKNTFGVFFETDHQADIVDIFIWISLVIGDFMPLLASQNPSQEALAIFCYFGMLLRKLGSQWWLDRWAYNMLLRLYELLDDEHKEWVVLPPGIQLS